MRSKKSFLLLIVALNLFFSSYAREIYSRVRIQLKSNKVEELQKNGLEFDHGEITQEKNSTFFITTISSNDLKKLKQLGYDFSVIVADESAEFLKNSNINSFYDNDISNQRVLFESSCNSSIINSFTTPANFTPGSMGGYYTLTEMYQKLNQMLSSYPNLITKDSIGVTVQGRPIMVYKITNNLSTRSKAQVLFTALHHAREPISMMSVIFYMQYLLDNANSDIRIADLLASREIYFIPCVNPDGYAYNTLTNPSGGGMHRKNRNPLNNIGTNIGVDLNRNYSVDWNVDNLGSSTAPSSDTYCGTAAFSEKETQAIRNFVNAKNIKMEVDFHSAGNFLLHPYGSALHPSVPQDEVVFSNWFDNFLSKYSGYKPGTSKQTFGYYTNGESSAWYQAGDLNVRSKVFSYIIEIGASFWPASNLIIPLAKEQMYHNLQVTSIAGSYGEVQDISDINIRNINTGLGFIYRRLGLVNSGATISIIPLEGIQTVPAPVTYSTNLTPNILDTFSNTFPVTLNSNILPGNKIKYVWKLSTGDVTIYDTITKIYKPTILFQDDMETGLITDKWQVSAVWGYTSTKKYQGTKSLSDSPSGNYYPNTNITLTLKNAISLANATDAYISFWIYSSAENMKDKLRVLVSTNGVGTGATFSTVCGNNTINENIGTIGAIPSYTGKSGEWRREFISLKNFLNQSNVGIRFQFTSNNSVDEDGFYIDDIKIYKADVVAPLPPAAFQDQPPLNRSANLNSKLKELSIFPNPTNSELHVSALEGIKMITLMDIQGNILETRLPNENSEEIVFNVKDFAKGIYFIRTLDDSNSYLLYKFLKY